jgi:hypothetical protein
MGKTFQWDDKKFIRDKVFTIFYMPMTSGIVMINCQKNGSEIMKSSIHEINLADPSYSDPKVKYRRAKNLMLVAKPQHQKQVTEELLKFEHYNYDTVQRYKIAISNVIEATGSLPNQLKDKWTIIEFPRQQIRNACNSSRKKAEQLLKKPSKD